MLAKDKSWLLVAKSFGGIHSNFGSSHVPVALNCNISEIGFVNSFIPGIEKLPTGFTFPKFGSYYYLNHIYPLTQC